MFSSEATDTRSHHHGLLRRLGGAQDNEILTSAVAVALTMLLVAAAAVADAYRQWAAAPADEEADGFSAYLAALDLEESSANRYAVLVADVERSLTRDRGQST